MRPIISKPPQWEYSHAVNAGITLLSLVLIIAAVLAGKAQDAPAR
jgi:hypothetical protein